MTDEPRPRSRAEGGSSESIWSPLDSLIAFPVAFVVTQILGVFVIAAAGQDGLDYRLASQAAFASALVATAVGLAIAHGAPNVFDALGFRRPAPGWILKVAGAFVLYLVLTYSLSRLVGDPEQTDIPERLGFDRNTFTAIAAGILVIVAAPLGEETLFRGVLFAGLRDRLPFVLAALISGVAFGLVHAADVNAVAAGQLIVFGFALAWVYEQTGSIWAPISLHMLNNVLAFTFQVTD